MTISDVVANADTAPGVCNKVPRSCRSYVAFKILLCPGPPVLLVLNFVAFTLQIAIYSDVLTRIYGTSNQKQVARRERLHDVLPVGKLYCRKS